MTLPELQYLNQLLSKSWPYREWLSYYWGKVYVRIGMHRGPSSVKLERVLDIANIDVEEELRGRQYFTNWLTEMEKLCDGALMSIFVETVHNERLRYFFKKRGYLETNHSADSCYWRVPNIMPKLEDLQKRWKDEVYDKADEVDVEGLFVWKGLLLGFLLGAGVPLDLANRWINAREFKY